MAVQKISSFTVLFEPLPENGYMVVVPVLPGIVTYGQTLEEARLMAKDAIRVHVEGLRKSGETIPTDIELREPVKEQVQVAI